jgi:hypothetical protein
MFDAMGNFDTGFKSPFGHFFAGGGAGVDINVNDGLAIRMVQVDVQRSFRAPERGNHYRVQTGVVFRFQ